MGKFLARLRRLVEADFDELVDPVRDPRTELLYRLDRDLAETLWTP